MASKKEQVRAQFGRAAPAYLTSRTHAQGWDLQELVRLAAPTGREVLLDVSTGAGHTAAAFAPHVAKVIASDLTPEMLDTARTLAGARGLANIEFQLADAEALPYPDASFDLVTCRIAAHHYPDLGRACAQMARVLRPGGKLLVVDNYAPEPEVADRFINAVEKVRDPSHVRARSLAEWHTALTATGLRVREAARFTSDVDFDDWVSRARTPGDSVGLLRVMLRQAPDICRETFRICPEPLGFILHKVIWVGEKG